MGPFEDIVKGHFSICGIADHVEELRQAMEPHYGTAGAENLNSLSPSPRMNGSIDRSSDGPLASPALSRIKQGDQPRRTSSGGGALACCASPAQDDDSGMSTPSKSPRDRDRSRSHTPSKESGPTFITFEEPGILGIRFEEAGDKSLLVKGLIGKGHAARFHR